MTKIEKLITRLKSQPNDFTYDELLKLLNYFNFTESNKGKTSGSRVKFINELSGDTIFIHKPHPKPFLKKYQIKKVLRDLKDAGHL